MTDNPAIPPTVDDVAWLRVEEPSDVGAARRAVSALAQRLAFPEPRTAEIALATTELATNLHKHARQGVLLLRATHGSPAADIEVVVADSGPGMADGELAFVDGYSTSGTLGIGLGAVRRLADGCHVWSALGKGTVLAARFRPQRGLPGRDAPDPAVGVTRPMRGEEVCGDAYAMRELDDRLVLMLCDGAGHGPLAASASQQAVRAFREAAWTGVDGMVRKIHDAIQGTRGGAVAVAELDWRAGVVRFCGVGNIAAAVVADRKRGMVSIPGVAGYQAKTIRPFEYPMPDGAVVVLHSDGLTDRWAVDHDDGLFDAPALLIAVELMRTAGVRRDDACVVVGKRPRP